MSLSSLIVQREVASIRQVEEALARQVLYGGDLVTNLLEVVQVPESVLVPLLAESLEMIAAPIGLLPAPTAQARALVPEDVAARRVVMPLSVDGDRLTLAVSEPLGQDVIDEISFALGVQIEERVAPMVRIREALARVYGVPLERRMARLVGRLAGVDPTMPNSLPPVAGPKASAPPLPGALSHELPKLNPPGMPILGTLRFPEPAATTEKPRVDSSRAAPPSSHPPSNAPVPIRPHTRAAHDVKAVLPQLVREARQSQDAGSPRRRGPVTLDRVTEELADIKDREGLLNLFFDFGRQFFEFSALFVVHGDIAEGRDAFGSGAPRERVVALGVPLDIPSMLRAVRDRAVPLCVYPDKGGLDAVLMGDLRRDARSQVLTVPIVVRSRVVAFFIADDGASGIDSASQGSVATVAALVGREFERLIVRMKLQGFTGEAPSAERRVDPRRVEPKRKRHDPGAREAAVQALAATLSPVPGTMQAYPPPHPAAAPSAPPAPAEAVPEAAPAPVAEEPTAVSAPPAAVADVQAAPPETQAWVDRPGALRSNARAAPVAHADVDHPPSSYGTLRNFLAPLVDLDALEGPTDKVPNVELLPAIEESAAPEVDTTLASAFDYPPPVPVSLSDRPPPPQAAAVHRPSDIPIPREEVDEHGVPIRSTRGAEDQFAARPPADIRQARLLREIDLLAAQFVESSPVSGRASLSSRSPQSISVPPHLPPTSSRPAEALPSVIVDQGRDTIDRLAETFVADPKDELAEAELLRLGQQAMPSIMRHFPGPITISRDTLEASWPRVTECGPILRLIAGQRRVALPFVLARTEDSDSETRFWATFLLTELAYPEAIPTVVTRLFDDSKRVRRAAREVARVLGDLAGPSLVTELDKAVRDPKATSARRVVTLDALGEMRDPLVVPVLLSALSHEDEDVGLAARRALMLVCRQDFGLDTKKWLTWWHPSSSRSRIEWLIDALTHEVPGLRRAAGQELKSLTEEYFGYYDDLPRKDRERVQQKYRDWWKSEGQMRFRKA